MKYSIVYSSLTGNTKMLAETIKANLKDKDIVYYGNMNDKALDADIIYIGFWTDKGTCDSKTLEFLKLINNKKIFLFGTAGFGVGQDYFDKVIERVKTNINNDNEIIGSFMCQGKMGMGVRKRYEAMRETSDDKSKIDMLIQNFDEALKHPNEEDLDNLIQLLK